MRCCSELQDFLLNSVKVELLVDDCITLYLCLRSNRLTLSKSTVMAQNFHDYLLHVGKSQPCFRAVILHELNVMWESRSL